MLINCPRCGFSQPKDQYCAQCGVDMESFKPKSIPITAQVVRSTKTHVILLLIAAVFVGQYVIRSEEPQRWVQKITHSQGVTKSKSKFANGSDEISGVSESSSEDSDQLAEGGKWDHHEQLEALRNKEISVSAVTEKPIETGLVSTLATDGSAKAETTDPTFRIIYAEVPITDVNKWITDSSSVGLYQNLQEYSAGIIADFRKKMDSNLRVLKVAEKKLATGQSDTNFSGTLGEESGQIIGLATNIDFRSHENGNVHGAIVVNRTQKQGRANNFPAEFDLPKGAAFFMLGVLRNNSFTAERDQLNMPPFQVFKSPDFAARKTEFVIILEPEYK